MRTVVRRTTAILLILLFVIEYFLPFVIFCITNIYFKFVTNYYNFVTFCNNIGHYNIIKSLFQCENCTINYPSICILMPQCTKNRCFSQKMLHFEIFVNKIFINFICNKMNDMLYLIYNSMKEKRCSYGTDYCCRRRSRGVSLRN